MTVPAGPPDGNGSSGGWMVMPRGMLPPHLRDRGSEVMLLRLSPAELGLLTGSAVPEAPDLVLRRLVARGESRRAIARVLSCSPRTVERRIAALRRHYGVRSSQELTALLAREGY